MACWAKTAISQMQICRSIDHFRAEHVKLKGTLGLVPTMGYLHEGHLSLIEAARRQNSHVAASLFVNPAQFNNPDDLTSYPRNEARDLQLFEEKGVVLVFMPSPEEMYPPQFQTYVSVENISQGLEGEHRPDHFRGVATVVSKLFNIIQPTRAYFGQKDAQQVAVIKKMCRDLNFPVEIVACPTVREADGLAMSSRNAKLSPEERQAATVLYRALRAAKTRYDNGNRDPNELRAVMNNILAAEKAARIEYFSVADAETLMELKSLSERPILLSMAVYIGKTRLIDNLLLD